ncbi:MAG: hypothetical protein WCP39_00160 [Chlamydiota bacterium]
MATVAQQILPTYSYSPSNQFDGCNPLAFSNVKDALENTLWGNEQGIVPSSTIESLEGCFFKETIQRLEKTQEVFNSNLPPFEPKALQVKSAPEIKPVILQPKKHSSHIHLCSYHRAKHALLLEKQSATVGKVQDVFHSNSSSQTSEKSPHKHRCPYHQLMHDIRMGKKAPPVEIKAPPVEKKIEIPLVFQMD